MKNVGMNKIALATIAFAIVLGLYFYTGIGELVTFESLKRNREMIYLFVESHYAAAVAIFIATYISTAFFVPGALVLTIAAGYLFGVILGSIYVLAGAMLGAAGSFYFARFFIGQWVHENYGAELKRFNDEIKRHGTNYMVMLRLLPIFPFFLVNFLAGVTTMSASKYLLSTVVGMLPGIVIYTYAGAHLRTLSRPSEAMSPVMLFIIALLAILALVPVFYEHVTHKK